MMRSMYSGVSGLKTHQIKMDVIGNNIANVNTVAYKSNSITFSELMYQTTQKASGANALTGTGGTNARQIGLGVKSAAIGTAITSQGATQTTGNPFDICITGESFFIVNDGASNFFTRAGAFNIDSVGNLVMASNGYNVMGWGVDPETLAIKKDIVEPLRVMSAENLTYPPEATTQGYVSGILDKNDPNVNAESGKIISLSFYDNMGYAYTAKFSIHATTGDGAYYVVLDDVLDSNAVSVTETFAADLDEIVKFGESIEVSINEGHNLVSTASVTTAGSPKADASSTGTALVITYAKEGTTPDPTFTVNPADTVGQRMIGYTGAAITDEVKAALQYAYGFSTEEIANIKSFEIDIVTGALNVTSKDVVGTKLTYDTEDGSFTGIDGAKTIVLDFADKYTAAAGGDVLLGKFDDITIDWTATNMYNNNGTSTIGATNGTTKGVGTGRKLGNMTGITIQQNGMIYASYDNGMTRLMGQIAVAEFTNPEGLEKAGDNLYQASLNSGEFDGIGVDITGSGGYMTTGVLEMSNVDLSAEFTEMITTQRGFQANSRIITVSDTMLEELVNLKR